MNTFNIVLVVLNFSVSILLLIAGRKHLRRIEGIITKIVIAQSKNNKKRARENKTK